MDQSEKETFHTGTKAAAMSGITTVFNMPNTKPPAITAEIIQKWMKKAENNIYTDVTFIAGVPENFNEEEVKKII
ncbi:MAG: dihydroorotase, partial [Promethearchaeota archaeon]